VRYRRMPIEEESPEQLGYGAIRRNLAESSVADAALADLGADLGGLVLQYGDHLGLPELREAVAADVPGASPDDVLVTPGAVAALFLVHTTLLEAGDHLVVARPNYATNVETPRAIGADVTYLDLEYEDGWTVDPDRIAALVTPRTKLVSLTTPHNPTGTTLSRETLGAVIALCERSGARLLLDETYREMTFGEPLPIAAGLSPSVISVTSLSKTYGLPGIRIGWAVTRDRTLRDRLLAAKEQVLISGSVVDETIALHAIRRRPAWLPDIRARIDAAFTMTAHWLDGHPRLEWVPPRGGVVGFPRIRPGVDVDPEAFYRVLFDEHGTIVGPGHWFERPRSYFRLGYGWPAPSELADGLAAIDASLEAVERSRA
jgi:aspartate/methionine/tyrosine aminotransferase